MQWMEIEARFNLFTPLNVGVVEAEVEVEVVLCKS